MPNKRRLIGFLALFTALLAGCGLWSGVEQAQDTLVSPTPLVLVITATRNVHSGTPGGFVPATPQVPENAPPPVNGELPDTQTINPGEPSSIPSQGGETQGPDTITPGAAPVTLTRTPRPTTSPTQLPPTLAATATLNTRPPPAPSQSLVYQEPLLDLPEVAQAKERLNALGYASCTHQDYGGLFSTFYTRQADLAVRQFQAKNGILETGEVDLLTWNTLFSPAAQAASLPVLPAWSLSAPFDVPESARSLAYDGERLWVVSERGLETYDPVTGEFNGTYKLAQATNGYQVNSVAFDGKRLWVMLQGRSEALLQRYDPGAASGTDILTGELAAPLRFDSLFARGLSFGAGQVWVAVELSSRGKPYLQPVNASQANVGSAISLKSEEFPSPPAVTDNALWSVLEGIQGDFSLVEINLSDNQLTYSGLCGNDATFDGANLWLARQGRVFAYQPDSWQPIAQAALPRGLEVQKLTFSGGKVWLLDTNHQMRWLISP